MAGKVKESVYVTSDLKKTTDFYSTLLGASPTKQAESFTEFIVNGFKFHFNSKSAPRPKDAGEAADHLVIFVPDLDKVYGELSKKGIKFEVKPTRFVWGYSAYLRDRDGRQIELKTDDSDW